MRLHTYNRACLGQERLSFLALMHIHYQVKIDLDEVVNLFATKHLRRLYPGPRCFLEQRQSREAVKTSREAARGEKPLVTLDLNLTFMQTSAVKRVKLIVTKRTNHNLAITRPLGITNQTNQSY